MRITELKRIQAIFVSNKKRLGVCDESQVIFITWDSLFYFLFGSLFGNYFWDIIIEVIQLIHNFMSYEQNQFLDFSESQRLELLKSLFVAYTINSDEVISNYRDFEPSESGKEFIRQVVADKWNFNSKKLLESQHKFKEFAAKLAIIEFFNKLCFSSKFIELFDLFPDNADEYRSMVEINGKYSKMPVMVVQYCMPTEEFEAFKNHIMQMKAFDCILYALDEAIRCVGSFEKWAQFED